MWSFYVAIHVPVHMHDACTYTTSLFSIKSGSEGGAGVARAPPHFYWCIIKFI